MMKNIASCCILWSLFCVSWSIGCLQVPRGRVTFDSEGNDNPVSRYFSRVPHVPSASSGITIGRGYDLGRRSFKNAYKDLRKAGIDKSFALGLAKGAGLRGTKAKNYLQTNDLMHRRITTEQQCNLFLISYGQEERIAIRVVEKYTEAKWGKLISKIQQILVDLKYRGDLVLFKNTPSQRALREAINSNSLKMFRKVMANRSYWKNVPRDRFKRRVAFLMQ